MQLSQEVTENLSKLDPTLIAPDSIWVQANELLLTNSLESVTRIMGYDIKDYDRMLVAGQLVMLDLVRTVPGTVEEYLSIADPLLNENTRNFLTAHASVINELLIKYSWTDYRYDYVSATSMSKLYLGRVVYGGKAFEKPSTMYVRICAQIYHDKPVSCFEEAFVSMARGEYTVASAAMLNAGFSKPQMASCFTKVVGDTRIEIYKGLDEVGEISAGKGGLGITVTPIRHSDVAGASMSKGLVPMCKLYDGIINYSKQGGARNGALTFHVAPWHIDIREFIQSLDDSVGKECEHLHHSDICLWVPWIFWDRVRENGRWTLFCPKYAKNLQTLYGHEFSKAYVEAENDPSIPKEYRVTITARELLRQISSMWQRRGKPFIMNGDSANFKSNHRHIGYIPGSNLCLEIVEYIDNNNMNVCNLSSVSLSSFARILDSEPKTWDDVLSAYDFKRLAWVTRLCVRNVNNMIDVNYSPLKELYDHFSDITGAPCRKRKDPILYANGVFRSLGIGVQGLSTAFQKLDLVFNSSLAEKLDESIFACMYFNAIAQSIDLALKNGGSCPAHSGSPMSEGKFQFDLWEEEWEVRWGGKGCQAVPSKEVFTPVSPADWGQEKIVLCNGDTIFPLWSSLSEKMVKYGLYNSLLLALMPTMSSAKPLRNSESVELHPSCIYGVDLGHGSFTVINYLMVRDLKSLGVWNKELVKHLIINEGHLDKLHEFLANTNCDKERLAHLQKKYIGMMKLSPLLVKKRNFRRNKYICQSTSSNVCIADARIDILEALFMIDGELGNKTVQYYLYQESQVRNVTLAKVETHKSENVMKCENGLCCSS